MSLLSHLRMGERLGALSLLLLLLAVLTGVSITQAGLLDSAADQLEDQTLPALRQVHELRRVVDQARGLEALHLLSAEEAERERLETQLLRQRERLQSHLNALAARSGAPQDATERRLNAQLADQLARWWVVQDKVLAASRAAAAQPQNSEASQLARRLMAADSQTAWQAVGEALDQCQRLHNQRAAELARGHRAQAELLRIALASVLGLVLLASVLLLVRLRRRAGPALGGLARDAVFGPGLGQTPAEATGLPASLDSIVTHSRLLALNAAVQAARQGAPSPTEQAERAHLAAEAEALARRCDAVRRGLRLGMPRRQAAADSISPA